jgi:hypothetical protein
MRNLSKIALGTLLAAGLTGTAVAAAQPDQVILVPVAAPHLGVPIDFAIPDFDAAFAQMDRQMAAAMQQMEALSRQPLAGGPASASLASYGNLPSGSTSYSSVTISQNGHQCSRSTEVISRGAGKPPKVSSKVSGDCGPQQSAVQPRAAPSGAPVEVPTGPIHQS